LPEDFVLDEVRRSPEAYEQLCLRTSLRLSRALFARAEGLAPDETQLHATMNEFMTKQGLSSETEIKNWQAKHELNDVELSRLLSEQAEADCTIRFLPAEVEKSLVDTLKLEGAYALWASKARARDDNG
jgi:hypothetical protein